MTPMRIRLSCYCISYVCIMKWWFLQIFPIAISGTVTPAMLRTTLKLALSLFCVSWRMNCFQGKAFHSISKKGCLMKRWKSWGRGRKIPVLVYVIDSPRCYTAFLACLNIDSSKKAFMCWAFSALWSVRGCLWYCNEWAVFVWNTEAFLLICRPLRGQSLLSSENFLKQIASSQVESKGGGLC